MNQIKRTVVGFASVFFVTGALIAGNYQLDPAHTMVLFKVKHLGISTVTGQFKEFSGSFDLDPNDLGSLKVSADIKTASIDTEQPDRDNHLRSPDFLDVEKYPEINFVSTKAERTGENKLKLHGDLTIRGVTKPVVLEGEYGGSVKDLRGNQRAAFTATTTINRKDFGVSWNRVLDTGGVVVSEEVTIVLEVEGIEKVATE